MSTPADWSKPPTALWLAPSEVHLWSVSLEQDPESLAAYERLLAPDERERAARFRFDRDRDRYVVARAVLRVLLGRYLGEAPAALRFEYGPQGKPALPGTPLHFNLAHAGAVAVYAVTRLAPLGVDVERVAPMDDLELVAESHFADEERRALRALPAQLRTRAFFDCWTRKEAFIKALGGGLSIPLADFAVELRPAAPPALRWVLGDPGAPARWTLHAFEPVAEHVAALAIEAREPAIRSWRWDG